MKPALSLAAVPGRRRATIGLAQEIEKRGYAGIYLPSFGDAMGLATTLALSTDSIPFGTTVQPIYFRQASDFATSASFIHELSGGRFRFGNSSRELQSDPALGKSRCWSHFSCAHIRRAHGKDGEQEADHQRHD